MGAKQGVAHIFIAVENSTVTAGQEISCIAHLLLHEKIKFASLDITFTGRERLRFQGDGIKTGKYNFIQFKNSLLQPGQKEIPAGSYSFPFIIEIPKNVPGTFKANMKRFEAKIQYKAKIELRSNKELIGKSKSEIIVEQTFDQNRYSVLANHAGTIVCCDCCRKGVCELVAHIDKNAYLPQESAKLWVSVNNGNSRRGLSGIGVMFWRVIRLISNDNEVGVFKKCIFNTNVNVNVASGEKLLSGKEIQIDVPIYSKEIEIDQCVTTVGKIVQCRYFIEITTDFGRCMSRIVDFEVPLIVVPKFTPPEVPSAPEDWHPIEMPIARFSSYESELS